jgi:transposase InsO family protein
MWLYLLHSKDEAADSIRRFQAKVERETGRKLKTLRTDRGGEFNSSDLSAYLDDLGVHQHLTAPYTPQQNGVVERQNQTVVGTARCMLKAMGVPARFWGEPARRCPPLSSCSNVPTPGASRGRHQSKIGVAESPMSITFAYLGVSRTPRTHGLT